MDVDRLSGGWLTTSRATLSRLKAGHQGETETDTRRKAGRQDKTKVDEQPQTDRGIQPKAETEAQDKSEVEVGNEPVYHVLVSAGHLVATLTKVILFRLHEFFPLCSSVYSSSGTIGKVACFRQIVQRFGSDARYTVVGDGAEEENAVGVLLASPQPQVLDMAFVKVRCRTDLASVMLTRSGQISWLPQRQMSEFGI